MAKKKKKSASAKKAAAAAASRGVVGPDYVQVLSGTLASKNVTLVLCGESHHDAIDVTRAGGGKIKEGWIPTDMLELAAEMVGKFGGLRESEEARFRCGICKRNNKAVPFGKAREWGKDVGEREIEYIPHGHQMALLWVAADKDGRKGRSYLVELFLEDVEGGEGGGDGPRSHLPSDVTELLDCMTNAAKHMRGVKSLAKVVQDMKSDTTSDFSDLQSHHTLLSWDDLDAEARQLNHRRLLGEEISTSEYDELIRNRKQKRRKDENLWTWDDWLAEVQSKLKSSQSEDKPALHVVIESAIPPCEVELCRDVMPEFEGTHAADCIRCLSEDSDPSEADFYDPAADGFGSYIDYSYRRLLVEERNESRQCLHCVDCRDLGCEHACVEESLHKEWMDLLEPEERERLLGSGTEATHAHHKDGRCLPDWGNSQEEKELDNLRSKGVLKQSATDEEASDTDAVDTSELITFPSFESFLGQCTDILYYAPELKVAYAPFIGKCMGSFDKWNAFFDELFFGGTVDRALSMLDLSTANSPYLHIRSPIMKYWIAETGEYEWHERDFGREHNLTLPMLPVKTFLKAKGSNPPRTWTSNMFALLSEGECKDLHEMAADIRKWVLDDIVEHCANPKLSDDEIGGGEWFLAYLRQCHREIYEDIDRSDPTALLRKQYTVGETKKHRIGDINIPNCGAAFYMIREDFERTETEPHKPTLSRKTEVMAKILIDIYMSKLIDAATVARIGNILSEETRENVTIVCYLGSVHTRAVCEFFTQPKYGFKRKKFCGKQDWEEDEGRIIHLPAELWSL